MTLSDQAFFLLAEIVAVAGALLYGVLTKMAPFPFLFLVGVAFYWILPLAALTLFDSSEVQLIYKNLGDLRGSAEATQAQLYFLIFSALALLGHSLGVRGRGEKTVTTRQNENDIEWQFNRQRETLRTVCLAIFVALWIIFIVAIISIEGELLQGYQGALIETQSVRSSLSAYAVMMAIVAAIGLIKEPKSFFRWLSCTITGWMMLICCAALLALGGRLYVIGLLLTGVLLMTESGTHLTRWIRRNVYLVVLLGLLAGWIGIVRTGEGASLEGFFINIISESLWTGYSMLTCADELGKIELFAWPENFLSSSVGLLPSALIGNKQEYIISLQEMGYAIESPQGACSVFASVLCNFGTAGGSIFFLAMGYFYGFLWSRRKTILYCIGAPSHIGNVVACVALSIVPFGFFRDPFSISIFQMGVKNALVFPIIVYALYWCVKRAIIFREANCSRRNLTKLRPESLSGGVS